MGHDCFYANGVTVPVMFLREITMPGEGRDMLWAQKINKKAKTKTSFALWCLFLHCLLAEEMLYFARKKEGDVKIKEMRIKSGGTVRKHFCLSTSPSLELGHIL